MFLFNTIIELRLNPGDTIFGKTLIHHFINFYTVNFRETVNTGSFLNFFSNNS